MPQPAPQGPTLTSAQRLEILLRLADSHLVLGHRLSQWVGQAPTLEEELALGNIALDLLGTARPLYAHAATLKGDGVDEDYFPFRRQPREFRNCLLVEQPNGDFAHTIVRQLLFSLWAAPAWDALMASSGDVISGVAGKACKEARYHSAHASLWLERLGDGTAESHARAQSALDALMPYTAELFEMDAIDQAAATAGVGIDFAALKVAFEAALTGVLQASTLQAPKPRPPQTGGRRGLHSEHLGQMLALMQSLHRSYPGVTW